MHDSKKSHLIHADLELNSHAILLIACGNTSSFCKPSLPSIEEKNIFHSQTTHSTSFSFMGSSGGEGLENNWDDL